MNIGALSVVGDNLCVPRTRVVVAVSGENALLPACGGSSVASRVCGKIPPLARDTRPTEPRSHPWP